jgi:hypothetical protein
LAGAGRTAVVGFAVVGLAAGGGSGAAGGRDVALVRAADALPPGRAAGPAGSAELGAAALRASEVDAAAGDAVLVTGVAAGCLIGSARGVQLGIENGDCCAAGDEPEPLIATATVAQPATASTATPPDRTRPITPMWLV